MLRSAASKVMWVGKATVFLVGLAVILALLFGVASMAFASDGQSFILGERNVAQSLSTLVKTGAGPALSLQVGSGAPLAVNSDRKVTRLNADTIDGLNADRFAQGRVSISGSPSQNFGTIVEHFEGFGNYGVGLRKVVSHPEQGNPIDISISCTNQNTLGALRIENKGEFGDSQFVWVDDGSTNPSFTTLLADNFTDRPVPTGSEHLTIRITNVFSPTRMATIELFTRHGNTGCDANAHAIYTFAP